MVVFEINNIIHSMTIETLDVTLARTGSLITAFADDDEDDIDDDGEEDLDDAGFSIEGDEDEDDDFGGKETEDEA